MLNPTRFKAFCPLCMGLRPHREVLCRKGIKYFQAWECGDCGIVQNDTLILHSSDVDDILAVI